MNAAHVVVAADGPGASLAAIRCRCWGSVVDIDGHRATRSSAWRRVASAALVEPFRLFRWSALAPKLIAPDWATVHGWQWLCA
ncbi:MAG: hypothetical protein U0163_02020 [Gemmatimonadaceae bacterium]